MLRSRTEAIKAQAVKAIADRLDAIGPQLDRIEEKLDQLLARDVPEPTATAKKEGK